MKAGAISGVLAVLLTVPFESSGFERSWRVKPPLVQPSAFNVFCGQMRLRWKLAEW